LGKRGKSWQQLWLRSRREKKGLVWKEKKERPNGTGGRKKNKYRRRVRGKERNGLSLD